MAQNQLGVVVDFNFTNANNANDGDGDLTDATDYVSITSLKATLAAYDAFTYTTAALDAMTVNDMVFAVRSIQDPTTIANYMVAQTARTS